MLNLRKKMFNELVGFFYRLTAYIHIQYSLLLKMKTILAS